MKKIFLMALAFSLSFGNRVLSQTAKLPLSADSLATGNYKDVINSFFQLSFDRLTGPEKELRFTSNPYAIMARLDTSLLIDDKYYKYRYLRRLNFSFAVKLDTAYKFNGFSSGIKYALIDRRDETVSRTFLNMVTNDKRNKELDDMTIGMAVFFTTISDTTERKKIEIEYADFRKGKVNFAGLSQKLSGKIKELAKTNRSDNLQKIINDNPAFSMVETSAKIYDEIKTKFNKKFLWTLGLADTTYKDQFIFSNIVLTTEMLKGISDMEKANIELNFKAAYQFTDDTLKGGRDLKRGVLSVEPGVNFVLKNEETLKSWFEFKIGGGVYHTFSSLYKDEERTRITLNGLMRVRIFKDIWIPLEIRYDRKSKNFLGFLNIRANFTTLGKLIK